MARLPTVLLSSVFGPYGVDDAYGRKENVMELFHNQVTREQGAFSLRFNHHSFGLHFIAANIEARSTVLDFPSERRFIREVRKCYDYVGISFIAPNFKKAQRMAEVVREHSPGSKIVLGGHGTRLPEVESRVEHDHICRGEGVFWMRRLLGETEERPLVHPAIASGFNKRAMGVPLSPDAAVLLPGVGCSNACNFCATRHFFDKTYTPYFDTGRELFDVCCKIEEATGFEEFFVMDENFLERPKRARQLMELMEKHGKTWRFGIFSSAETIADVGIEFLARLGVSFLWLGVESKQHVFAKNHGHDLPRMIHELRDRGISVLASGILFLEHHDKDTIWDDIEYVANMEADFVQYMQLAPFPRTDVYEDMKAAGRLLTDIPYEEWHGQHRLWFAHPHFSGEESETTLRAAFQFDYDTYGASLLRMTDTALRGYERLAEYHEPYMVARRERLRAFAQHLRPLLPAMRAHAHNAGARALTDSVSARYHAAFGPMSARQRMVSWAVRLFAAREAARAATGRNVYQPRTSRTRYHPPRRQTVKGTLIGHLDHRLDIATNVQPGAVAVRLAGVPDNAEA